MGAQTPDENSAAVVAASGPHAPQIAGGGHEVAAMAPLAESSGAARRQAAPFGQRPTLTNAALTRTTATSPTAALNWQAESRIAPWAAQTLAPQKDRTRAASGLGRGAPASAGADEGLALRPRTLWVEFRSDSATPWPHAATAGAPGRWAQAQAAPSPSVLPRGTLARRRSDPVGPARGLAAVVRGAPVAKRRRGVPTPQGRRHRSDSARRARCAPGTAA